jgi:hypothetical protein
MDLEALVVAACVFADDYRVAARQGRQALVLDAELVALAVAQAAIGINSDRRFLGPIDRALPGFSPPAGPVPVQPAAGALVELISGALWLTDPDGPTSIGPLTTDGAVTISSHTPRFGRRSARRRNGVADWDRADHPAALAWLRGHHRARRADRAAVHRRLLTPLVFYLVVGAVVLGATLLTRFESRVPAERDMTLQIAA